VKTLGDRIAFGALLFLTVLGGFVESARAQGFSLVAKVPVGAGWHPWYETKADPEDSRNLIICGTKWDGQRNSPFGFVYVSGDSGANWQIALEDRNSAWVTEHSCAFGPHHRAYFISEASKVVDGELYHHLGTTRLYVSTDGGWHWKEEIKTGWADFSTSAVSSLTGKLYTFFHWSTGKGEPDGNHNVGLLVFSHDGRRMSGPFFDSTIQRLGYSGIYPSDAIALKSGAVVTLYRGVTQGPMGSEGDLGIIGASPSLKPSLVHATIAHTILGRDCINTDEGSLAYDAKQNRLFVLYVDGCKDTRIMLAFSDDEGRTWTKGQSVVDPQHANQRVVCPSLVASADGVLGLLWKDGRFSGRWLFSRIQGQKLLEPTELSHDSEKHEVSEDSLWTVIDQWNDADAAPEPEPSIKLKIRSEQNVVWRGKGLIAVGDKVLAVWPLSSNEGKGLYAGTLGPKGSVLSEASTGVANLVDVTRQTVMLYGGMQRFDRFTKALKVCLALENRGDKAIKVPIKLEVSDIRSPLGAVSILDSRNDLARLGALLDISDSVTGYLAPNSSSNPFCLSFRLEIPPKDSSLQAGDKLLSLKMKVLALGDALSLHRSPTNN
jgi:hypothetical protein